MSLELNLTNLALRVSSEAKSLRTLVNGNFADLSALNTDAKGNLVAAINELVGAIGNAGVSIDDGTKSGMTVWSSNKTDSEINAAVAALVGLAPGALDTFAELATAIGDDPDFTGTMLTALGLRVRVDAAQSFDGVEQAQGRDNIGAGTSNLVIGTTIGTAADAKLTNDALSTKGTSNLTLGTSSDTAKAGNYQPTVDNISDAKTIGKAVLKATSQSLARSAIGAGTGSSDLVIGAIAGTAADGKALADLVAAIGNTEKDLVGVFEGGL